VEADNLRETQPALAGFQSSGFSDSQMTVNPDMLISGSHSIPIGAVPGELSSHHTPNSKPAQAG